MKNLYRRGESTKSTRHYWSAMALFIGLLVWANLASAQVTMTWTGTSSNNFLVDENWNPAGSPSGNDITIPLLTKTYNADSTVITYVGVKPVLTGSESLTVRGFSTTMSTDTAAICPLTVNLDPGASFIATGAAKTSTSWYPGCIIVNSGTVNFQNSVRMDNANSFVEINGGTFIWSSGTRQTTFGSNSSAHNVGVQFRVNHGKLVLNNQVGNQLRTPYLKEGGFIIIKNDGVVTKVGSEGFNTEKAGRISIQDMIDVHRSINGGTDFYPVASYDPVTNLSTITVIPMNSVACRDKSTQEIMSGETTKALELVLTDRVRTAKSIAWKYRKGNDTNFVPFAGADSTVFAPVFNSSGIYKVIAEIVDANDQTANTEEVTFSVLTDDIALTPKFDIQYIRTGESGTKITATFKDGKVPTAMEWKYSDAIGGNYVSFDPPQKAATINPVFNLDSAMTGKSYYMILEATIDGNVLASPNVRYVVEYKTTTAKVITWTGMLSGDAKDQGNWNPVASSFKNSLIVNSLADTLLQYPAFNNIGKDTIQALTVNNGATLTVDGPDSLDIRGEAYIHGKMFIKSGVVTASVSYFRIPSGTSELTISGDAQLICNNTFFIGDAATAKTGGRLYLKDNAKIYCTSFDRVYTKRADSSVVYLSDNAVFYHKGDVRTKLKTFADSAKFVCTSEGYEPYILYPYDYADTTWTLVVSRNTNAFSLTDDSRTFTTAGYPIGSEIGLTNIEGVTSWEWKYSTSINGPWKSFSPAAKDLPTYAPSFDQAGSYYVVAESSTGLRTSNMKLVSVIDLSVTPSADQVVAVGATCDSLSITIPTEVTLLSGAWFILDADGNEMETGVSDASYLPTLEAEGVYDVFYYAQVQDENSVSYDLFSNKVKIYYGIVPEKKVKVGYFTQDKTMTGTGAATVTTEPVLAMLQADPLLEVTVNAVAADATVDPNIYDVVVIQESFGGTSAILKPAGSLGLANIKKPFLYNKLYAFKKDRAIPNGGSAAGSETEGIYTITVDAAKQSHDLFKGFTFADNAVKLLRSGADDNGGDTKSKALNYANAVEISTASTLLGLPTGITATPTVSINDVPAGTVFGGETLSARMITFGMNFGAICKNGGTNLTDAGLTLWRNAIYSLGGLEVPSTLLDAPGDDPVLSNDATLSALTVSAGTLSPAFSAATTTYTVNLPTGSTKVTFTATANHAAAKVTGAGEITLTTTETKVDILVTAEDGTTKTYTVTVTVGLSAPDQELAGIRMYPNPADQYINIEGLSSRAMVKVFNAAGQQLINRAASGSAMRLALNEFSQGVYMLRVEADGKAFTSRFVKQ